MRKLFLSAILLISTFISAFAIVNPVNMLNDTIVKTQNSLIKNADEYQQNPYKLLDLINQKIIPIVATDTIAQVIVGSDKWNKATPKEQKEFIKTTTEMFTFMYAKNVAAAGKYKIILFLFAKNNDSWKDRAIVLVNGSIKNEETGKSSDMTIRLYKKDNSWHIYDLNVAGVSILNTYKVQFAKYDSVKEMITAFQKVTKKLKEKAYPEAKK